MLHNLLSQCILYSFSIKSTKISCSTYLIKTIPTLNLFTIRVITGKKLSRQIFEIFLKMSSFFGLSNADHFWSISLLTN